jgi:DNA mismatch endonuclease (patch repair protein)
MADVVDGPTRSRMMAGIRGRDTRPELELRRALHARGFRFRVHVRELPGRPDVVLPKWNAVVLVHGCFWHRHEGCRYATTPATRQDFWEAKFAATMSRDVRNVAALRQAGWRTATVWECELRREGANRVADRVVDWIRSDSDAIELPS